MDKSSLSCINISFISVRKHPFPIMKMKRALNFILCFIFIFHAFRNCHLQISFIIVWILLSFITVYHNCYWLGKSSYIWKFRWPCVKSLKIVLNLKMDYFLTLIDVVIENIKNNWFAKKIGLMTISLYIFIMLTCFDQKLNK